jgi:CRISPR-associated endonuclease Csn1
MEGRMSFSRRAIDKLLPHLERGLPLMSDDGTPSALSEAGYLRPDQRPRNIHNRLPKPPELPNPIVRQALFETRKVLNAIISEYGAPREIRIELAREMKAGAKARETMNKQRWERERKNSDARSFLEEQGWPCKPNDVRRYALWKEQSELCVYTGQQIRLSQLFGGEVDIDHILPYPRSLDNSLMNKVVCFRFANAEKADQTPREWLEQSQPDRYEQVLQRVRGLPYPKRLRFARETCELDDFVARQLVDTAYITRSVAQYLRCLGCSIVCGKGQMTAELRHQWGLDTVLRDDGLNKKNREDHRHHAVDALVVALTNRSRLQQLARGHHQSLEPWAGFRQQAEDNIKSILVSHRARRRVRGALHSATVYGTTQKKGSAENVDRPWARNWVEESMVYVRRKPVASIDDTKQMSKVRDATIRELLKQYLRDERRIDPNQPQKLKPKDWEPLPCMISRKGQRIPIKRVRMLEEGETFRELRANAFVKPDANHHIVYYEMPGGKEPSWSAEVVTRWDAVQRVRAGLPAVDRASSPTKKFLMSLSIGDTFTFERDGIEFLSVVQKLDQRSKRVTYKLHTDARRSTEVRKDNLYLSVPRMREFKARKVVVDYLGRLRWAND